MKPLPARHTVLLILLHDIVVEDAKGGGGGGGGEWPVVLSIQYMLN